MKNSRLGFIYHVLANQKSCKSKELKPKCSRYIRPTTEITTKLYTQIHNILSFFSKSKLIVF